MKNEKKAVEGPVGTITDEQRKELENAPILAYSYFNGKLNGTAFGKSFWKSFNLNPDNNINKPVYGMKGRKVLSGKQIDSTHVIMKDRKTLFVQRLSALLSSADMGRVHD